MDELEWIRRGLAKPNKSKQGLAKALGRSPSVVSNILAGKRNIKTREMPAISSYFGDKPPAEKTPKPRLTRAELPLPEGIIRAEFPAVLSEESHELAKRWFERWLASTRRID